MYVNYVMYVKTKILLSGQAQSLINYFGNQMKNGYVLCDMMLSDIAVATNGKLTDIGHVVYSNQW